MHNNQLVIPGEKTGEGISGGFIAFVSPMNVTISNNFMSLITFGAEFQPTASIMYYAQWCNLQDDLVQTFYFVDNIVERDTFPTFDIVSIVSQRDPGYRRNLQYFIVGNTLNVTYSNINVFSLVASELTPAYIANNVFYPSRRPYVFSQGLVLLQLVNNTFVDQISRAAIDCLLCVYMEVKGMTFTNFSGNADALFDIVTLPQIPVALIFNDVRLVENAFVN